MREIKQDFPFQIDGESDSRTGVRMRKGQEVKAVELCSKFSIVVLGIHLCRQVFQRQISS
jgi:hypothetical protein